MKKQGSYFFEKKQQKTFVGSGFGILLVSAAHAQSCPVAGQRQEMRVTLYFGRDRAGQNPVSEREWQEFSKTWLTKAFPEGFTETDGMGQWRDPATGQIIREASKIVDVVANRRTLSDKIAVVTKDYRKAFHQKSVGVVTETVCAVF